jgi:hypothetical protein
VPNSSWDGQNSKPLNSCDPPGRTRCRRHANCRWQR